MSAHRGVWLVVLLLFLAGTAVLIAALALNAPRQATSSSMVLVFDVPYELEESEPPHRAFPFMVRRSHETTFDAVQALDRAGRDGRVRALVLHVDAVSWGWGKLAEIRDAVTRFRAAGKPVYAVLEGGGEAEYFLASAANLLASPPVTTLQINGLSASALFMRGTLDKLDVHPNFAHAGRFKSAVETFTREGLSPPAREALAAMLDDVFTALVDSIASARGLERDSVLRLVDDGPYGARAAHARGLVDTLLYVQDVDSLAVRRAGHGAEKVPLFRYGERAPGGVGPHIALVTGAGSIVPGRSRYVPGEGQVLGAETMVAALREARERRSIRAVVLRIDTPGGVVDAADEIWREVSRCRSAKPVIVSMSDLAASGGYYLSTPATEIVAQPGTITGSIGVFGGKLNVLGLYRKLGLNVETVARGAHAEMLSPFRDFTPDEAERYQRSIEESYQTFLERVSAGRGLSIVEADSIGQGRVWTGKSAYALGLVDTLGGLDLAFDRALDAAGYEPGTSFSVDVYPRVERTLFDRFLEEWFSEGDDDVAATTLPPVVRAWLAAAQFPAGKIMAILPWSIEIR